MNRYTVELPVTCDLPAHTVVSVLVEATDSEHALIQAVWVAEARGYEIDNDRGASVIQS